MSSTTYKIIVVISLGVIGFLAWLSVAVLPRYDRDKLMIKKINRTKGADRDIDTELDWWSNQVDKMDKTMLTIMDNTYRLYPVLKETSAFAEFNKNI
jgi:hypothetical protein